MIGGLRGGKRIVMFILAMMMVILYSATGIAQDTPINEKVVTGKEEKLSAETKDIKGVVVDMLSGQPIEGAKVCLLGEETTTAYDGRFIFKDVSVYHFIQITARITTDLDVIIGCSYFSVPANYYPVTASKENKMDVKIVNMLEDAEVVLKINDYSIDDIDRFCSECHESSPCLIEEEYGKAVTNKVNLKGVLVKQSRLEEYIEKMRTQKITFERYKKIRYLDSHPQGIDITATDSFSEGRIALPEGLKLKQKKIITCDTCHTRHVPTEFGQFVVMDFNQKESVCIKCHK